MHHRSHDEGEGGLHPGEGDLHPRKVCIQGEGGLPTGGICIQGDWVDPLPLELEKKAVRILLACFLVHVILSLNSLQ